MTLPWSPVVIVDIAGSATMLVIAFFCVFLARQLANEKPDDIFRNYVFLFTVAIAFFAVSRSFGHLVKQILLLNDMGQVWKQISPFSGAVNSTTFVVIFAFGIYFRRFQKVHQEIEYYKSNLEELITQRTDELEKSKNVLENILNNSNPINITNINFDLVRANDAYYSYWPVVGKDETIKCYDSRPGDHCHTDNCPLKLIIEGHDEVVQEVSKDIDGEIKDFIITARPFHDLDGTLIGMVESFQDITLRKRAERAMQESEERFRLIFETNPDPVVLARLEDGEFLDVNKAFEGATGIARADAVGENSEGLGFWVDTKMRSKIREKLKRDGEINNYEADFKVVGGYVRTGLISARTLNVGVVPCILVVIRDITTEKAAERALVQMDRMKSEFISTAAHELNTPLSSMMAYAEILRDPEDFGTFTEAQKKDFIVEIYENGEALSRIIDDLLDISRIESGKSIPLVLQETNLIDILKKKIASFKARFPQRDLCLILPEKIEKAVVTLDQHRVNQAIENLLSNAEKYSDNESKIVLAAQEKDDHWEIRVEDLGVGMSPDQVSRVFDKFYRADASNTAISGLGLGMSIVKQVIEAHGGKIWVESALGEGTTAFFTLPYDVEERLSRMNSQITNSQMA